MINFIYGNKIYNSVIDSMVNPVIKFLPEGSYHKTQSMIKGELNISFFTENIPHSGSILQSHGIADKLWREYSRVKDYDYVFVSGPLWREKYLKQGMKENKIKIIGYSKLDPIFNGDIALEKINDKPTILFAPTHNTAKAVSIQDKYNDLIPNIPNTFNVIESRHPAKTIDKIPTMQLLANADIVVSDCSSLIYEAWALDKQVIFLDWLMKDNIKKIYPQSFEDKIYSEGIGLHAQDPHHFIELLNETLSPLDQRVIELIEGILPKCLRGNSGKITAETLLDLDGEYNV